MVTFSRCTRSDKSLVPSRHRILSQTSAKSFLAKPRCVSLRRIVGWKFEPGKHEGAERNGGRRGEGIGSWRGGLPFVQTVATAARMPPWHAGIPDYLSLTHRDENCTRASNSIFPFVPRALPSRPIKTSLENLMKKPRRERIERPRSISELLRECLRNGDARDRFYRRKPGISVNFFSRDSYCSICRERSCGLKQRTHELVTDVCSHRAIWNRGFDSGSIMHIVSIIFRRCCFVEVK